ncbi:MAG TPA: hypothetical protein VF064_16220, partial [Pyrinomonadaceae bacterium]
MFYFASDNPLAPEIVSQLKSIKQAGFHPEAHVVAQFDPHTENTSTHIFDINRINKLKSGGEERIGFVGFNPNDPFVVNMMTDKIWGKEEDLDGNLIRELIKQSLKAKGIRHNPPKLPARPP